MSHPQPGTGPSAGTAHQLAAACAAFDDMVAILGEHARGAGHLVTPMVMALAAAADGRDVVIAAPACPAVPARPGPPRQNLPGQPPEAVADALAEQARLLSTRMAMAAPAAQATADADALASGSRCAAAVHDFLSGTGLCPVRPWASS